MRGFRPIEPGESHRVRRWDAVVLGGALPGLVAAACIARAGRRVLLVEEEGSQAVYGGLREPFHLCGPGADHILGGMLRELAIPLIERRTVVAQEQGLQVVLPDARIDIGPAAALEEELCAWRLASPEASRPVLRALEEAGARERRALLLAPLVRAGRRLPFQASRVARGQAATEAEGGRGIPRELAHSPSSLRLLCDVLVRALGDHACAAPSSEASARLLGSALEGSHFVADAGGLRGILFRRLEALGVERRALPGKLRFVSVAGQPGLDPTHSDEIWTGRILLTNAPLCALGAATEGECAPPFELPPSTHQRVSLHFRTPRELLPETMGDRVIVVADPADPVGAGLVRLRTFPGEAEAAELVASAVAPSERDPTEAIERSVHQLLPFSDDTLIRQPVPALQWDRDSDLGDPANGGWPGELELRISSKPPVHALDRRATASLGFEGDLLLGWRAGETLAAELA